MDKFREFEGKDLDACIRTACEYFNAPREKLEIEIIQDAKSGIFGIVLARKAKIRARHAQLADAVQDILKQTAKGATELSSRSESGRGPQAAEAEKGPVAKSAREKKPENSQGAPKQEQKTRRHGDKSRAVKDEAPKGAEEAISFQEIESGDDEALDFADSASFLKKPEELDRRELSEKAIEIVSGLVKPLAGRDVNVGVSVDHGSVHARVAWQGDAGLLIGREGQTLAALQYLASRMLSRAFNSPLRVQLDIGEYRSRQDEKLRALALSLAEKARQSGRSFSTRPLSSYHRRIIHLALQDQADLFTRSSGDGSMKRVIISVRKSAEK